MSEIYTKAHLIEALKTEIAARELGITAIMVLDSLIDLMVPAGPLKRVPKPLNISVNDLAFLIKRDPRQVKYAVEDLLQADLIDKIPICELDSTGYVSFSQECFDLSPVLARCGFIAD